MAIAQLTCAFRHGAPQGRVAWACVLFGHGLRSFVNCIPVRSGLTELDSQEVLRA